MPHTLPCVMAVQVLSTLWLLWTFSVTRQTQVDMLTKLKTSTAAELVTWYRRYETFMGLGRRGDKRPRMSATVVANAKAGATNGNGNAAAPQPSARKSVDGGLPSHRSVAAGSSGVAGGSTAQKRTSRGGPSGGGDSANPPPMSAADRAMVSRAHFQMLLLHHRQLSFAARLRARVWRVLAWLRPLLRTQPSVGTGSWLHAARHDYFVMTDALLLRRSKQMSLELDLVTMLSEKERTPVAEPGSAECVLPRVPLRPLMRGCLPALLPRC